MSKSVKQVLGMSYFLATCGSTLTGVPDILARKTTQMRPENGSFSIKFHDYYICVIKQ
jgi:hypothetical protein